MRISDWSSDVCSSDLHAGHQDIADVGEFQPFLGVLLDHDDGLAFALLQVGQDLEDHVDEAWLQADGGLVDRSEEHTSELQSLMRISYAVFCLKKKNDKCNYIIPNESHQK